MDDLVLVQALLLTCSEALGRSKSRSQDPYVLAEIGPGKGSQHFALEDCFNVSHGLIYIYIYTHTRT